jgi:hypothetical protein
VLGIPVAGDPLAVHLISLHNLFSRFIVVLCSSLVCLVLMVLGGKYAVWMDAAPFPLGFVAYLANDWSLISSRDFSHNHVKNSSWAHPDCYSKCTMGRVCWNVILTVWPPLELRSRTQEFYLLGFLLKHSGKLPYLCFYLGTNFYDCVAILPTDTPFHLQQDVSQVACRIH